MKGKFLFLGTGGSAGIPVIGCNCSVCLSHSPYNKRLRPSALIQVGDKNILIDVGPDFRTQALKYNIQHLSGVLLTHAHADHIAGMDDLRPFYFIEEKKLPCFLSKETFAEIKARYYYMLELPSKEKSLPAQIDFQVLPDDFGFSEIDGIPFSYFSFDQLDMKVTGFKVGNCAYVSDIRAFSKALFSSLQDIDTLVISATTHKPTKMHFSVEEAIAFSSKTSAKQTYLMHISHALDHEETKRQLPKNVHMSYDGLEFTIG